jgi:hypothetical protein
MNNSPTSIEETQTIPCRKIQNYRICQTKLWSSCLLTAAALAIASVTTACGGGNLFENAVTRSDSDKAQAALESGNVDSAISTLEDYLQKNPNDTAARSMLANAYLKKSGVDLLKIGSSMSSGASGQSDWTSVSGALPAGTSENIGNMQAAIDVLKNIPESQRTDDQNYQLAIAQTTLAVTVAKKATGDGSGQMTDEKVDQMSDSDARTIYDALQGSKNASGAMSSPNDGLTKVGSLADTVDQQPGSTPEERLRNFLKSQN